MNNPFTNCSVCGSEYEIMSVNEVPKDVRETFPKEASIAFFCNNCNEYTYGGTGSFDDFESEESSKIKFVSKPALNSLCPCGSGKKYKRCCGRN